MELFLAIERQVRLAPIVSARGWCCSDRSHPLYRTPPGSCLLLPRGGEKAWFPHTILFETFGPSVVRHPRGCGDGSGYYYCSQAC